MTTIDREDLYQRAYAAFDDTCGWDACVRAVVDLVLAEREPTADGEALAQLVRGVRDSDPGYTTQIDGVLIAKCDEYGRVDAQYARQPQPWEVLREAQAIFVTEQEYDVAVDCKHLADDLETQHRAAQEKAAAEAEREKLIEQAAQVLHRAGSFGQVREWADLGDDQEFFIVKARALADAGLLTAPETTDGGAA